jgi:cysteine desulfurase/selenocysteine lyase
MSPLDLRKDFSIFDKEINGRSVIYMDSACVTLKPVSVIRAINKYYNEFPACGSRSGHKFGRRVGEEVFNVRKIVKDFLGAKRVEEIVFMKNSTEGINLTVGSLVFEKGDVVLVSDKEHNSVLLPCQLLKEKGVELRIFRFGDIKDFKEKLTKNVRLVVTAHVSNLDGTSNPVEDIVKLAHKNNSLVLLDAAQSAGHRKLDVRKLDVDFLVFSGHKIFGPSGTGILYGKLDLLKKLRPFVMGGSTVIESTYEDYEIEDVPERFEAGLQNYAGIIGLGEAIKYLENIGFDNIEKHEYKLNELISKAFVEMGIGILGGDDAKNRSSIISFNIDGIGSHEVAGILDGSSNIMIRSGRHCVHSWFNANGLDGSARISLSVYNTEEECKVLIEEIKKISNLI